MTRPHFLLIAPLLIGLIATAASLDDEAPLEPPAPVDDGRVGPLENWKQDSCAECHAEIAEEWASSLHALAWVDERYQGEVSKVRRKKSCWGCHVPEPMHQASGAGATLKKGRPAARTEDRHYGITCESCHLGPEGEILGPWGEATDAHRSVKSDSFGEASQSALCIVCHQTTIGPVIGIAKDFVKTKQAENGLSCVGCHMAEVERSAAIENGEASPIRKGKSHALQTPRDPAFLRRSFDMTAKREGDKTILTLVNKAGHRIPGTIDRVLTLAVRLVDESGKEVARVDQKIDFESYLAPDRDMEIVLEGKGARLEITGRHKMPGVRRPILFVEESLPLSE